MAQIARQLSAEDVSALAHWLAAQPVPAAPRAAAPAGPLPLRCGGLDGAK
jgi:cytochrome c553